MEPRYPAKGTNLLLKSNEIKYIYELVKEERHESSLKILIKSLKIVIHYKIKEIMDKGPLFSWYFDSSLTPWSSFYIFAQQFLIKVSFLFVVVFKISPAIHASNNTPCVGICYCATPLRNHRLFLIPHFDSSYGIYRRSTVISSGN